MADNMLIITPAMEKVLRQAWDEEMMLVATPKPVQDHTFATQLKWLRRNGTGMHVATVVRALELAVGMMREENAD